MQAVFTLIVLVMLIRRITDPLQQMIDKAWLISEGDLSRTIPVLRNDEIGLLAETINGLTSNVQELVAFGLSAESSLRISLKALRERPGGRSRRLRAARSNRKNARRIRDAPGRLSAPAGAGP